MLSEAKTNCAIAHAGFQPVTPKNTPQNVKNAGKKSRKRRESAKIREKNIRSIPQSNFIRIPWHHETNRKKPFTDASRWLYEFGQWILYSSDDIRERLELMNYEEHDINVRGVLAVDSIDYGPNNNPFTSACFDRGDNADEGMADFFNFHIAKARLEQQVRRLSFWREVVQIGVVRALLNEDKLLQFDCLFEDFLGVHFYYPDEWAKSGLSTDDVLAAFEEPEYIGTLYYDNSHAKHDSEIEHSLPVVVSTIAQYMDAARRALQARGNGTPTPEELSAQIRVEMRTVTNTIINAKDGERSEEAETN